MKGSIKSDKLERNILFEKNRNLIPKCVEMVRLAFQLRMDALDYQLCQGTITKKIYTERKELYLLKGAGE